MSTITLHFSAVDGSWQEVCKNIVEAGYIFLQHVGSDYIVGSTYAVSSDGVVTCRVEGITPAELFAEVNSQVTDTEAANRAERYVSGYGPASDAQEWWG